MLSTRIAICIVLLGPSLAGATTVVSDTNILLAEYGPPGDYELTVFQDAAGTDPTSIYFDYDGANVEVVSWNLDEGSDWYLVAVGDEFTRANVAAGLFTVLYTANDGPSGPVPVGSGDFYLGVSTGRTFGPSGPGRDSFGWIELTSSVTGLGNGGNAIAYDAEGIVVGTAIPIPEPTTGLQLALGLAALAVARSRRGGARV